MPKALDRFLIFYSSLEGTVLHADLSGVRGARRRQRVWVAVLRLGGLAGTASIHLQTTPVIDDVWGWDGFHIGLCSPAVDTSFALRCSLGITLLFFSQGIILKPFISNLKQ